MERWGIPFEFITLRSPDGIVAGTDKKVVMGFFTRTDAGCASLTSLVGNPDSTKQERKDSIKIMIDAMIAQAKREGFKVFTVSTSIESVAQKLMDQEFTLMDKNLEVYGRIL